MRFFVTLAATAAAIVLSGCTASATIGAPTTPTPAALPTPSPPQVIYLQPPPAQPAGVDVPLVIAIVVGMTAGAIVAALITYELGKREGLQSANNQARQYSNAMYRVEMTPAEWHEWQQLQAFKSRQIAQGNREVIHVRR